MELANRHGFPLLTLIDTPGAYPGVAAEQHGQGGAIARSQAVMARLDVPTVAVVIGEGGSGGAVAIAVADRVLMQENAIYSVISPEGCAAILWRDASQAKKAASAFRLDAAHCLDLGVIEGIVPEPEGGAQTDLDAAAILLRESVVSHFAELDGIARPSSAAPAARSSARWASSPSARRRIRLSTLSTGLSPARKAAFCRENAAECDEDVKCAAVGAVRDHGGGAARRSTATKRDPKRTPEPFGGARRAPGRAPLRRPAPRRAAACTTTSGSSATACSLSWAVPKGVPLAVGERHLAVHVEDHPLDYADFEGEIPAGQYGAGTVEIWDRGTYELVEEKKDGGLTVRLHGDAARGALDARARAPRREGEELAPAAQGRRHGARASTRRCSPPRPTSCRSGEGWAFEPKWDGFRALARVERRRRHLPEPQRQRPHDALRRPPPGPSASPCGRRPRCSTARSARSTRRAARASGCCRRARARSSSSPSTCSSWTASRSSTARTRSGARRSSSSLDTVRRRRARLPVVRRRRRARAGGARARARGGRREARRLARTGPAGARPTGAS